MKCRYFTAMAALLAYSAHFTRAATPSNPATARVAVVGGGIAGAATVLELLERGFQDVTLIERNNDLLQSTSSMIAATVNFDTYFREDWKPSTSLSDGITWFRKGTQAGGGSFWLEFVVNGALRAFKPLTSNAEAQKRKVYRLSRERLLHHLELYPELCDAAIGYWCCEAGDAAKAVIEARGFECPTNPEDPDSPFGLFQLAHNDEDCKKFRAVAENEGNDVAMSGCDDQSYTTVDACRAAGHTWTDITYSYYDEAETEARTDGFLQEDIDEHAWCSLNEHQYTGFIRTEEIFKIFTAIFEREGVKLATSCTVSGLDYSLDGKIIVSSATSVFAGAASTAGVCSLGATEAFDKVVISSNVGSIPILKTVDPNLDGHLFGFKGYGLMPNATHGTTEVVEAEDKGRAVKFLHHAHEYQAAYARTTATQKIKIWGGADPAVDRETEGPYEFCSDEQFQHIFEDGPSAALDLASDPTTIKNTGMRPVPSLGNVGMLKRYEGDWNNLFLNTGYGYNGYDLAWFSSQCIAEWVADDALTADRCQQAVQMGKEKSKNLPKAVVVFLIILIVVIWLIFMLAYPCCLACNCKSCLSCCACYRMMPWTPLDTDRLGSDGKADSGGIDGGRNDSKASVGAVVLEDPPTTSVVEQSVRRVSFV